MAPLSATPVKSEAVVSRGSYALPALLLASCLGLAVCSIGAVVFYTLVIAREGAVDISGSAKARRQSKRSIWNNANFAALASAFVQARAAAAASSNPIVVPADASTPRKTSSSSTVKASAGPMDADTAAEAIEELRDRSHFDRLPARTVEEAESGGGSCESTDEAAREEEEVRARAELLRKRLRQQLTRRVQPSRWNLPAILELAEAASLVVANDDDQPEPSILRCQRRQRGAKNDAKILNHSTIDGKSSNTQLRRLISTAKGSVGKVHNRLRLRRRNFVIHNGGGGGGGAGGGPTSPCRRRAARLAVARLAEALSANLIRLRNAVPPHQPPQPPPLSPQQQSQPQSKQPFPKHPQSPQHTIHDAVVQAAKQPRRRLSRKHLHRPQQLKLVLRLSSGEDVQGRAVKHGTVCAIPLSTTTTTASNTASGSASSSVETGCHDNVNSRHESDRNADKG